MGFQAVRRPFLDDLMDPEFHNIRLPLGVNKEANEDIILLGHMRSPSVPSKDVPFLCEAVVRTVKHGSTMTLVWCVSCQYLS